MKIKGSINRCSHFTFAILLLTAMVLGQTTFPASRKTAALVGFRVKNSAPSPDAETNVSAYSYETWLIVRDATGAHVAAKMADIIVPRKSGFWRVGVQPTCQIAPPDKTNPDDHGNIHTEAVEYAVPLEQVPSVGISDPPCDPKTAARMLNPARDANADDESEAGEPTECGFETEWLEGVLPDLVSVARHEGQSDSCEPRGFHWTDYQWVRRIDKAAAPHSSQGKVSLESVFGVPGERAWKKVVQTAIKQNTGEGCFGNETVDPSDEITDWYFEHSGGAWNALAFVQIGNGGCQLVGDPRLELPRSLTAEQPLPSWVIREVRKKHAANTVHDAWISPDGSWLIESESAPTAGTNAYEVKEVSALHAGGERIGVKMLGLPANDVIMLQWATGRFVDQWLSALAAAAKGLPSPIVKVISSSE